MPNWVTNYIEITAQDSKQAEEILSSFKGKDSSGEEAEFSFSALVPMPENIYRGDVGKEEREKYGENNWYDWSVKNWGTKWDVDPEAVDARTDEDKVYLSFDTAWSCPEGIIEALADKFPNADILCKYADEDKGHNCGIIHICKDENIFDKDFFGGTEKGFLFALELWDESLEEYMELYEVDTIEEFCDKSQWDAAEMKRLLNETEKTADAVKEKVKKDDIER